MEGRQDEVAVWGWRRVGGGWVDVEGVVGGWWAWRGWFGAPDLGYGWAESERGELQMRMSRTGSVPVEGGGGLLEAEVGQRLRRWVGWTRCCSAVEVAGEVADGAELEAGQKAALLQRRREAMVSVGSRSRTRTKLWYASLGEA